MKRWIAKQLRGAALHRRCSQSLASAVAEQICERLVVVMILGVPSLPMFALAEFLDWLFGWEPVPWVQMTPLG